MHFLNYLADWKIFLKYEKYSPLDSLASKSLSSSMNSLDQVISAEGVTFVEFADTFATKNDYALSACALVGTSQGKAT